MDEGPAAVVVRVDLVAAGMDQTGADSIVLAVEWVTGINGAEVAAVSIFLN